MSSSSNRSNDRPKVAFVSTRIAGSDGVSLEIEKWAHVLERVGIDCYYIAGELDRPADRCIPITPTRCRVFVDPFKKLADLFPTETFERDNAIPPRPLAKRGGVFLSRTLCRVTGAKVCGYYRVKCRRHRWSPTPPATVLLFDPF